MDLATQELVRHRANERCEYCGMPQTKVAARFHVDHIIAKQHERNRQPVQPGAGV